MGTPTYLTAMDGPTARRTGPSGKRNVVKLET